jgi:hypothetical protein
MKKSFLRIYDNVCIRMDKAVPASTYQHSDKLGAGAAKRKKLKNPDDKFEAVMREFAAGKLHSGSGEIVKDRQQALAIAGSESGKYMKEDDEDDEDKKENMAKASDITAIQEKIIAFLKKDPSPKDEDFHKFIEKLGKEHSIGEQAAYRLLGSIVAAGMSNKGEKKKIDPEQLAMGIKVEMEHTANKLIAEKIARDHLTEFPDYYTALDEMEKKLKAEKMRKAGERTGHKYVKREAKSGGGWRYFYKEGKEQRIQKKKEAIEESGENKSTMPEGYNKKIWDHFYHEALNDKKWAYDKEDDKEWIKNASDVSKKMLDERIKKSVTTLAKEKYDYLEMRSKFNENDKEKWDNIIKDHSIEASLKDLTKKDFPEKIITRINNPKYSPKVDPPEGYSNDKTIEKIIEKKDIKDGFEIFGEKFFIARNQHKEWSTFESTTGKFVGSGKSIADAKLETIQKIKKFGEKALKEAIGKSQSDDKPMSKASSLLLDAMQKAKAMPVGTVSGQYKKVAEGKWEKVKSGNKKQKSEIPEKEEKKDKQPDQKGTKSSSEHKEKMKGILKKMASILADALSAKNTVQPTGEAVEQAGENIKPTNKKKVTYVRDRNRERPKNKVSQLQFNLRNQE